MPKQSKQNNDLIKKCKIIFDECNSKIPDYIEFYKGNPEKTNARNKINAWMDELVALGKRYDDKKEEIPESISKLKLDAENKLDRFDETFKRLESNYDEGELLKVIECESSNAGTAPELLRFYTHGKSQNVLGIRVEPIARKLAAGLKEKYGNASEKLKEYKQARELLNKAL